MPGVKSYRSHGRVYYYHRASNIRLRGEPGSVEFAQHLDELNRPVEIAGAREKGTISATILLYKSSIEYKALKPRTHAEYNLVLDFIDMHLGRFLIAHLKRSHVRDFRDKIERGVGFRNKFIRIAKRLMSFALDRDLVTVNPLLKLKLEKVGSWSPWRWEQIERFLTAASPEMRLAALVGVYTGQRLEDCLRMTWSAYNGETIEVKQGKTGVAVSVHCHEVLRAALDAAPKKAVQILVGPSGKPWGKVNFQQTFHRAVVAVGLDGLNFHGLRHTLGTELAETGASEKEIQASLGHESAAMAQRYTKRASQKRLARSAIIRLEQNKKGTGSV